MKSLSTALLLCSAAAVWASQESNAEEAAVEVHRVEDLDKPATFGGAPVFTEDALVVNGGSRQLVILRPKPKKDVSLNIGDLTPDPLGGYGLSARGREIAVAGRDGCKVLSVGPEGIPETVCS